MRRETRRAGRRSATLALTLSALLIATLIPGTAPAATEECGPRACVSGAKWTSGEVLSDKERARERKRKGKAAQLTVQTNERRGSVFIDGVWVAPAPALYLPIKAGKHDLEVRDGSTVLARGVLSVPSKGGDVTVRVF